MRVIRWALFLAMVAALLGGGFLLGRAYQAKQDVSAAAARYNQWNDITTEAIDDLVACKNNVPRKFLLDEHLVGGFERVDPVQLEHGRDDGGRHEH